MTIKLEIVVRTLGPLHITAPEDARVDLSGRRSFNKISSFPCSLTQTQRIPLTGEQSTSERREAKLPIIPANSIRGKLRRLTAAAIREHLTANGEKLSLPAWNGLQSGAIFGHPDGDLPTVDQMQGDYHSVYLGAWGGSPRLTPSSISITTGYPVVEETVNLELVPQALQAEAVSYPYTQVVFTRRVDDTIQALNPASENEIVSFTQSYADWIQIFGPAAKAALAAAEKDAAEEGGSEGAKKPAVEEKTKVQGIMSFAAREVVLPNITFHAHAECRGEPKHAGILIEALRRWAEEPWIGGGRRIGMGRLQIDVLHDGQSIFDRADGAVRIAQGNEEIVAAHREALDEIGQLSAGDIEELFKAHEKTKKSVAKALKGPALDAFKRLYG